MVEQSLKKQQVKEAFILFTITQILTNAGILEKEEPKVKPPITGTTEFAIRKDLYTSVLRVTQNTVPEDTVSEDKVPEAEVNNVPVGGNLDGIVPSIIPLFSNAYEGLLALGYTPFEITTADEKFLQQIQAKKVQPEATREHIQLPQQHRSSNED
jgi:hypothetical protein